jgi:hypothetical protein
MFQRLMTNEIEYQYSDSAVTWKHLLLLHLDWVELSPIRPMPPGAGGRYLRRADDKRKDVTRVPPAVLSHCAQRSLQSLIQDFPSQRLTILLSLVVIVSRFANIRFAGAQYQITVLQCNRKACVFRF